MSAIMRLRRGEPFDVRRVDGAEHRACMELVHGVYVASGYIEPCADGVRARQWDASGATFGAYKDGELAGCVTLVEDGALGLPSEALYPEIAALPIALRLDATGVACHAVAAGSDVAYMRLGTKLYSFVFPATPVEQYGTGIGYPRREPCGGR